MMQRIGLGVAIAAMAFASTMPAMADAGSCGDQPFPPAFPSLNDMARLPPKSAEAAKHQAFEDVVAWQRDLKTYRDCLNTLADGDNRKITLDQNSGSKNDMDDVPGLKSDVAKINALYNASVDTENAIVGNYDSVSKAYCARKDVDQASCQQGQ